jgi:hypothetical protein
MAASFTLPEQAKIVNGLAPATDAAGRTSAYISLKHAHKAYIVVHMTQGNAATILLSPLQASAVAGTGSKVLTNAVRIWANLDTAASDSLARATDAVNYTTDAGVKLKIVVFEIDPSSLDVAGGFDCIGVSTGASNVANITAATFYVVPSRYAGSSIPTVVTD